MKHNTAGAAALSESPALACATAGWRRSESPTQHSTHLVGNHGGGAVGHSQLAGHTQLLKGGGLHLHAQVLGHKLGARHNGNVLQQRLAPLAKAGGLQVPTGGQQK